MGGQSRRAVDSISWLAEADRGRKAQEAALHSASGDFAGARVSAKAPLSQVMEERRRAELAAELLAEWAASQTPNAEITAPMAAHVGLRQT